VVEAVAEGEVRRGLFMARLHLVLSAEEEVEFVASHLDEIAA
jgi:hypothetical protein